MCMTKGAYARHTGQHCLWAATDPVELDSRASFENLYAVGNQLQQRSRDPTTASPATPAGSLVFAKKRAASISLVGATALFSLYDLPAFDAVSASGGSSCH